VPDGVTWFILGWAKRFPYHPNCCHAGRLRGRNRLHEEALYDGVFGRCQDLAGAELYTYDISSSALQRLRILLQNLAHRGTHSTPNLHPHPQVVQRPAPPGPLYRAQNHGGHSFLLCCTPALE
ncbi:hypothetical protein ILYODFUR_015510, partial [Ilyodon furcidens]